MSNSWWADKLGTTPAAPAQRPVAPVYQQPVPTYQPPAAPPVQQRLPASATAPRCPNCSSGNYVGTMETKSRCYDCGYPVQQSGSGTPGVRLPTAPGGTVQQAKQLNTANNFNPNVIIDKIG
jgi:hypothetical protein